MLTADIGSRTTPTRVGLNPAASSIHWLTPYMVVYMPSAASDCRR